MIGMRTVGKFLWIVALGLAISGGHVPNRPWPLGGYALTVTATRCRRRLCFASAPSGFGTALKSWTWSSAVRQNHFCHGRAGDYSMGPCHRPRNSPVCLRRWDGSGLDGAAIGRRPIPRCRRWPERFLYLGCRYGPEKCNAWPDGERLPPWAFSADGRWLAFSAPYRREGIQDTSVTICDAFSNQTVHLERPSRIGRLVRGFSGR